MNWDKINVLFGIRKFGLSVQNLLPTGRDGLKAVLSRELEAEARQTKFEPRRCDPPEENLPSPRCIAIAVQNLVVLSQTV